MLDAVQHHLTQHYALHIYMYTLTTSSQWNLLCDTIVFVYLPLSFNSDFVHFNCECFQFHCPRSATPKLRKTCNLPTVCNIQSINKHLHDNNDHFTELAHLDRCLWTFTVPCSENTKGIFFVWMISSSSFIPDLWSSTLGQSWPELENTRAHMLVF